MDGTYYEVRELIQPRDGFILVYWAVYLCDYGGRTFELKLFENKKEAELYAVERELTL